MEMDVLAQNPPYAVRWQLEALVRTALELDVCRGCAQGVYVLQRETLHAMLAPTQTVLTEETTWRLVEHVCYYIGDTVSGRSLRLASQIGRDDAHPLIAFHWAFPSPD